MNSTKLRITQIKSSIGRHKSHQACLIGLGVKRLNQTVEISYTPENRGMVRKISYMLKIEEV